MFIRVCHVQWSTAVSQRFLKLFFVVTFGDFSTKCGTNKKFVYVILFLFLFRPTFKFPMALPSSVVTFSVEAGVSFFSLHLPCFSFPRNWMLCGCIFHNSFTCNWKTFSCFSFFLRNLVLYYYLRALVFLVYLSHLNLFSRTNGFISWGPYIPFLRC